jgi:hypothetical protein
MKMTKTKLVDGAWSGAAAFVFVACTYRTILERVNATEPLSYFLAGGLTVLLLYLLLIYFIRK